MAWAWNAYPTESGQPRKLFIAGDGTGAYIAALLSLDARYLLAAGLPPGAVTGVIGQAGRCLGGDDCYLEECSAFFPDVLRGDWLAPSFVDPSDPPMLFIAGAKDESEGIDALEALAGPAAQARIEVTTLVVAQGNGLSLFIDLGRPGTAAHQTVLGFIEQQSGP